MKKIILSALIIASFAACKNTQNATAKNKPSTTEELNAANAEKQMLQAGNDFSANGNAPANWSLQIDFDNKAAFTSDDGLALNFPANTLKTTAEGKKTTYTGKTSAGDIKIVTEEGTCTVPTIRKVYQKTVSVTINQKTYTGCGMFLVNEKLEGKWNLEKIGTTSITTADYNRVPVFNFDLTGKRISGNDGCNSIGGTIDVQGSKIKFSAMLSTKMACLNGKNIESIINSGMSNKTVDYYFKDGKLYLYLADDTLLVLTKA